MFLFLSIAVCNLFPHKAKGSFKRFACSAQYVKVSMEKVNCVQQSMLQSKTLPYVFFSHCVQYELDMTNVDTFHTIIYLSGANHQKSEKSLTEGWLCCFIEAVCFLLRLKYCTTSQCSSLHMQRLRSIFRLSASGASFARAVGI